MKRATPSRPWLWAPVALALLVDVAGAQVLPVKRSPPGNPDLETCPVPPAPRGTAAGTPAVTDSLLAAGSRAAILGDHATAQRLLEEAAALDPGNPVVSYRLARTFDEQGAGLEALLEYCRYLSLAPSAADSAEALDRIGELAGSGSTLADAPWNLEAAAGVDAYDRDLFDEAVEAFTRVIRMRPDWPDAYFNRAAAHLAGGRPEEAIADLLSYLERAPHAEDRDVVLGRIEDLRGLAVAPPLPQGLPERGVAPSSALVQGLVLPGLGQHATGRTGWGLLVLAAAGGAVYYGTRQEIVVRRVGAHDPFGNYYEYDVRAVERPHRALGLGAAGAITLLGAIESYVHARRQRGAASAALAVAGPPRPGESGITLAPSPAGGGTLAITIRLPAGR